MKKISLLCILLGLCASLSVQAQSFSLESIKSYPFPTGLTSSAQGAKLAWAFDEQGKRNVYVAEGPDFTPRKLTNYTEDDGQELTSLSISDDGKWVVYVRGGDHGSNWDDELPVNTLSSPTPPKVQIWSVPFAGGEPRAIAEGDAPVFSPGSDGGTPARGTSARGTPARIAFVKAGQVWIAPADGSSAAKILFTARGTNGSLAWSPDGSKLAFVCDRKDHAFVGVFTSEAAPITWIAPTFAKDGSPRWSPDGKRLVFVRTQGSGGAPDSILTPKHRPWSIWTADAVSGRAAQLWQAPKTLAGSVPTTHGGFNLNWAANDRIVFLSYQDNWPHLYSIASSGGAPLLLTPTPFMAEHITMSHDRKWLLFSGNTGPDKLDIDRRHVVRVPVDKATMEVLTPGTGLEWTPVVTGDGATIALISATAQRPPLPAVMAFTKGTPKLLGQNLIPASFPQGQLVTPRQVTFTSPDGVTVHGQLFEPAGGSSKKLAERSPALIYVHGGPPRQMLLGWNYSDYYANAYAMNQYLASQGFVVLSVNYRLGIGYGYAFHKPANGGELGASEYQDVRAAAVWLTKQTQVDPARIGIYGGSYGGYLTALALARDSKLFAAGVDIHGVHDWSQAGEGNKPGDRYEKVPDLEKAAKIEWEASPVSSVSSWTSPVLIIHGDDDRNVRFNQSTDLVRRLDKQGVAMETLVIVDDTHHWMKHSNALKMGAATADYFKRKLMKAKQ
ncbi:S9 family peptidase [Spirosoma utsteinense]|uniref:Acyl-peptide hydrolase n=1 Tax=Spirosoma utsteinense TaxID=2585773 RepID=A0ABR6WB13_9BACT|nr:prolyl oligopeptidase family serine peptidase [Spirosoma utsteinense]MBC3788242.1 dipeptidyl aminopeptidase/acylaminoacyl peptidase [Spirosoma utsteinense]MBC3793363.1 dipeptidyl aminopeptidase/acylaminoacyl peptidase [Spirosoma utsteinense]